MTIAEMRCSQAAVALIRQPTAVGWNFLCQWSDSWRALHLIGGHREGEETFRECAMREMLEELPVGFADVSVAAQPLAHLEYVTFSESAGVPTRYILEVFQTSIDSHAREKVTRQPENAWVSREQIQLGLAADGRRISPTVELILVKLGL